MSLRLWIASLAAAAVLGAAAPASAVTQIVDAKVNSSSGGAGVDTGFSLILGQAFSVTVDTDDLWSAGALPRWSNADGLTGNLFATGSDESGQVAGTLIGTNFGLWSQGGLSAPYGSLVGKIGGGAFFLIGTNFLGNANATGSLKLFYWDSNNVDNAQFVSATISAVPEPSTWAMMIIGFAAAGFVAYRRSRKVAVAAA